MRPLHAKLLGLMLSALAVVTVGCSAAPDETGGAGGQTTYGAQLPGDDGDDDSAPGDVGDDTADGPLVAVDDSSGEDGPMMALAGTSQMKTTANLNLRKGAGTSFAILSVIPSGSTVTLVNPVAKSGFLNITWNGTTGWASATYLTAVSTGGGGGTTGPVDVDGAPSPDNAFARAKAAVGFSYYWGGGAWLASGPTASTKGSCTGSCPSCSHSGRYGADCSGLVAKAWQYGTKALEVNSHPYSTATFVNDVSGKWKTVSRGAMKKGDALVYNSGGAGHIVLFEKGDGWGSPTVVECRGCSYGCVYNARSFTSSYHAIRRSGF